MRREGEELLALRRQLQRAAAQIDRSGAQAREASRHRALRHAEHQGAARLRIRPDAGDALRRRKHDAPADEIDHIAVGVPRADDGTDDSPAYLGDGRGAALGGEPSGGKPAKVNRGDIAGDRAGISDAADDGATAVDDNADAEG